MRVLLTLSVPGDPVPKGRPRIGRGGHAYTPARTEQAEQALAWQLRAAYRGRPVTGPVAVHLAFQCATRRRCDIDNLAKLVLDAGTGVVWADDQQVELLIVTVERGCSEPGTDVRVTTAEDAD